MVTVDDLTKGLRLAVLQVGYEQRSYWRNPTAALFTFAFPVIFLVIFGFSSGNHEIGSLLPGVRLEQYYVPSILTYGLTSACLSNLAVSMTFRRDQGILKRVRGTPLPTWAYLGGAVGSSLVVSLVLAVVTIGFGVGFFHVPFPHQIPALVVGVLVGAVAFCALGLAVATVVPNADAAPPMVNIVMFALLFISGTFYPVDPKSGLAHVAGLFPVVHLKDALLDAVIPLSGHPVWDWRDLRVVALWGAGGLFFAARRWRWETKQG